MYWILIEENFLSVVRSHGVLTGPPKLRLEVCHGFQDLDTAFGLDVQLVFQKSATKLSKCLSQIPGFSSMAV